MTIKHNFAIAGSAILLSFAISIPASATDWTAKSISAGNDTTDEQLYAAASDSSAITFTCVGTKLRAVISGQSDDAENILKAYLQPGRRITRPIALSIDGNAVSRTEWRYSPNDRIFVTPDRATTVDLYNAVVGQKPVTIERNRKVKYDFMFPTPNSDFAAFGKSCGVGNQKNS
ncbi:MAG: hypothetical protein ABJN69_16600 [Hellea sp.]